MKATTMLSLLLPLLAMASTAAATRQLSGINSYEKCGAGNVFSDIQCENFRDATGLSPVGRTSTNGGECLNFIKCGPGTAGIFNIVVDRISGTNENRLNSMYYARGVARNIKTGAEQTYCWKRDKATDDGCACLCEVVRSGTSLGMDPSCKCMF